MAEQPNSKTFDVANVEYGTELVNYKQTVSKHFELKFKEEERRNSWGKPKDKQPKQSKKILKTTEPQYGISLHISNGFVGTALKAYNEHYHLVLRPDDIWVAITTSLAGFIDKHAEEMRHLFVNHEGKKELVVYGGGSLMTANYDGLISQMSDLIDKNTKDNIREWLECNFSTTTPITRTVSKVVLMGAMKHYFDYKMCLECGLPKVTLKGTLEDWKEIRNRVDKLDTWGFSDLSSWSKVLGFVLDEFVKSYQGNVDKDFWNRIAHYTGGGSGPTYIQGWILAFVPFTTECKYVLNDLETIKKTNKFGKMDTDDVREASVEVPVTIDDNGSIHKTLFYAGIFLAEAEGNEIIKPSLDWALVELLDQK